MMIISTIVLVAPILLIYAGYVPSPNIQTSIGLPISYNQPKFCPNVSWDPNGNTYNATIINLYNIFIDVNNNIYMTAQTGTTTQYWLLQNISLAIETSILFGSKGIFVTVNDDIYRSNINNYNIEILTWNSRSVAATLNTSDACSGLFIDLNNTLYCSIESQHQVISISLTNRSNTWTLVAGDSSSGFGLNQLSFPNGIFVNITFYLYVADCGNDRIQLFTIGNPNGITVVGNTTSSVIKLLRPSGIVLDADNNLYIADRANHRIVVFGPDGLRCLVGCSATIGNTTYQLNYPQSLAFDSYGSIFVADSGNNRLQQFMLLANSCNQTRTSEPMPATTKGAQTVTNKDITTVISTTAIAKSTVFTTPKDVNFTLKPAKEPSTVPSSVSLQSTIISTSKNVDTTTLQTTYKNLFSSLMMETSEMYDTTTTKGFKQSTKASSIQNIFTTIHDTISSTRNIPINNTVSLPIYFIPKNCSESFRIGETCNTSSIPCDMSNPCQNLGICSHNITIPEGYFCKCPPGFTGTDCELDIRPCKSTTCWNNGNCSSSSNDSFWCSCSAGWEGSHCEQKINYCQNITCLNYGICRPLLLDYKCECLSGMYSGQHCEIVASFIIVRQYVSKSLASIAILIICSVIIFIVVLDVLKYVFHIDVSGKELQKIRRKKLVEKPLIAIRYVYVNKPSVNEQIITTTSQ